MELYQLKCFLAAADRGNFSRAAEDMDISQSSLSKIIARLETELGVNLFDREKGRIRINSNGILFQKYAAAALKNLEEGISLMQSASEASGNTIEIGCSSAVRFESVLELVQTEAPQCILRSQTLSQEEMLGAFDRGAIDVGFLETDEIFDSPAFEELDRQYFVVFMTDRHPMANLRYFPESSLSGEIVCCAGAPDERRFLSQMFVLSGVHPQVFSEFSESRAAAQLINSGKAVGIVTDDMFYHRRISTPRLPIRALPITSKWSRRIYMLHRPDRDTSPERKAAVDLLRKCFLEERSAIRRLYLDGGTDLDHLPS